MERYTHLNAEFQRIARRDKKGFLSDQCKEIKENNRMGKASDLYQEEPGRLQSMGSLRVGYDWVTSLSLFTFMQWRRKWQPAPVFLPGESQGRWSLIGCRLWGRTELDTTESTSSSSRDLFKKIGDTKGTFRSKMVTIKDRNGMDLTEVEDIKKR